VYVLFQCSLLLQPHGLIATDKQKQYRVQKKRGAALFAKATLPPLLRQEAAEAITNYKQRLLASHARNRLGSPQVSRETYG
jgi:hypothetical protein